MAERKGRKSAAQTPAPTSDRIKGSKINKAGSAASKKSAASIELSDSIVQTLKEKAEKFNSLHKSSVSVNTLKAVFRRGAGAFSTSHRPNISRNQWAFARVNKFLEKKAGHAVKKAYVQDDDLLSDGGFLGQQVVCHNCGWTWNTDDSEDYDKYVCHKCGFDNTLFYSSDIMGNTDKIEKWYRKYNSDDPFYYDKQAKNKYGSGIYFSSQPNSRFDGDKEIEVFVDYKNPKIYQKTNTIPNINFIKDWRKNYGEDEMNKFVDELFNSGYDAIIVKHGDNFGDELIIRDESLINIKDIKYKDGGPTFNDKELLAKYKRGESIGFTGIAHLKAKGLIPRADGTKRKSEKYMEDGGLIAPNGKKSNLTPEQYKLVRTPEFKAWFGDWEKDPENASKVVDENGEPLVVYHGSDKKFTFFDINKMGVNTDSGVNGKGFYFSNKKETANIYASFDMQKNKYRADSGYLYECFLSIKRPANSIIISEKIGEKPTFELGAIWAREWALRNGFDGVIKKEKYSNTIEFTAYNPNQIKLADGTNTTFDTNNPDIRYKDGGLIAPNGKRSNLTTKQYKLVRTPQFKAWFGDWENDPQNASKVVDENGEPMVVYHGTNTEFYEFDLKYFGKTDKGWYGKGFYFTPNKNFSFAKDVVEEYGGKEIILKVFLDIKNPLYGQAFAEQQSNLVGSAKDRNKDGVIIKYDYGHEKEGEIAELIVWNNTQIKLADGTNTKFDTNNLDIRYKDGGLLKSLEIGGQNLNKNGIVLSDYENKIIVIAYNSGNQERNASLYNKALIYKSIRPIRQANEIIERLDNNEFENFDERKIDEYKKSNQLIILNQNEVLYDSENQDLTYKKGGTINKNFNIETMELTPSLTISDIDNKYPEVSHEYINKQVYNGIKVEMEHTKDPEVAKKIALDHLNESIHYYEELEKMEKRLEMRDMDEHYEDIKHKYAEGGELKRTPSTDNSVWTAQYNVGDKVKIRVDFGPQRNVEKVFTIEKVEYVPGFIRTENPTGKLYFLSEHGGSWEGKDLESAESKPIVASEDSTFDEIFSFRTPSGEKSRLSYIQQVLVRTSAFKNWFGDWEKAANRFVADGKQNFDKHFKDVSKVIDMVTLEPRVLYHGTMSEKEFFSFDVTREKGVGRPYAYFAYNKPYAEHFTKIRQREAEDAKPFLYEVFLDVKHPFIAQGHDYMDKSNDAEGWIRTITGTIIYDRYKTIQRDDLAKAVESTIENQIGRYVKSVYPSGVKEKFWKLMAADSNKQFKFFLLAYDFDGVFYSEEFARDYDVNNPAQFTLAITVFDAHQIKLADARNTQFDPFNTDIRFKEGGKIDKNIDENNLNYENMNKLQSMLEMMEKGGKVKGDNKLSNDGKNGGFFVGKSHADGGIKVKNIDTDQIMEVEGNEVIINKRSVADTTKREFEGEMLTNREILSKINESGGGVKFADGGEVKYNCGCSKKSYNFGGEILDESVIIKRMNILGDPIIESKNYLSNLMNSIYG